MGSWWNWQTHKTKDLVPARSEGSIPSEPTDAEKRMVGKLFLIE